MQGQCTNGNYTGISRTTCPNGCNAGVCQDSPVNVFKGFTIELPTNISVDSPIDIAVTAVRNDNSRDQEYDKNAVILIDGDPTAILPLTAQKFTRGRLSINNAITFKTPGTKTIIVKDVTSGTESRKTLEVKDSTPTTPSTPTCPQLSPPPADFCKNGTVVDGGKNAAGCQLPPTCVANTDTCPQLSPPPADFCKNGQIIDG